MKSLLFATVLVVCALAVGLAGADPRQEEAFRRARLLMVERYLVKEGVTNKAVLASMSEVPRHRFVDPAW